MKSSTRDRRTRKTTITFNEMEHRALERYCKKYRVNNKTKFMREAIMKVVISKFSEDYPTLWDQPTDLEIK